MATVIVDNKKEMGAFNNEAKLVRADWDFALDGGAITDVYAILEAKEDIVILDAYVSVKTTCTSGGSSTAAFGVLGGDVDAILAATAVASLVANATFDNAAASKALRVVSGTSLGMTLATAAMTAGKMELVVLYCKF